MKLRALSHYDGDLDTRFGDCILLHNSNSLTVYDCGHEKHTEAVEEFLEDHPSIEVVYIVVSHNDSDHTAGVCSLLNWLSWHRKYDVTLYTHQYLKHVAILDKIQDERRTRGGVKRALLAEFDNIAEIIETAQAHGFSTMEALKGTTVGNCEIMGPTVEQFATVAVQAVDKRVGDTVVEEHTEETVMNAASIQLKGRLEDGKMVLLCGDAHPDYLDCLESCDIIQLPHHGQLDDAQVIFEKLRDPYSKIFLISDNTGSASTSGGSDVLLKWMKKEKYSAVKNTKTGIVRLPQVSFISSTGASGRPQGVKLGGLDRQCW